MVAPDLPAGPAVVARMALRNVLPAVACGLLSVALGACSSGGPGSSGAATTGGGAGPKVETPKDAEKTSLPAFSSKEELVAFVSEHMKSRRQRGAAKAEAAAEASPAPAAADGPADKGDSVTNNQTAGVDEGGIVKVHGEHLVVLRRGRLFTVKIGGGALEPISSVDAFAPGL